MEFHSSDEESESNHEVITPQRRHGVVERKVDEYRNPAEPQRRFKQRQHDGSAAPASDETGASLDDNDQLLMSESSWNQKHDYDLNDSIISYSYDEEEDSYIDKSHLEKQKDSANFYSRQRSIVRDQDSSLLKNDPNEEFMHPDSDLPTEQSTSDNYQYVSFMLLFRLRCS